MVDLVGLFLNVVGWVVAALVTLTGIYFLHNWQEWSRERREVFSPLHMEVSRFLQKHEADSTRINYPTRFSDEFQAVDNSGFLQLKRHRALRRDIETLKRLREEADQTARNFVGGVYDTVNGLYAGAGLESYDSHLVNDLRKGEKENWESRIDRFPEDTRRALLSSGTTPGELYDTARASVEKARKAHLKKAEELLHHASKVRHRLQRAMRGFRGRYRGRGAPRDSPRA